MVVWIFLSLSSYPGVLYPLPPSAQPCPPFGVGFTPSAGERPSRLSLHGQGWSLVGCGDLTRGHPVVSFRADKRAAEPQVRLGRGCGAVTRGLVLGWGGVGGGRRAGAGGGGGRMGRGWGWIAAGGGWRAHGRARGRPGGDAPALPQEVWLADAAGLPQGPPRGGAALARLAVPAHRAHRGRLRELVRGAEVPADRHGVVSSLPLWFPAQPDPAPCLRPFPPEDRRVGALKLKTQAPRSSWGAVASALVRCLGPRLTVALFQFGRRRTVQSNPGPRRPGLHGAR